jgi:hypothetical protein
MTYVEKKSIAARTSEVNHLEVNEFLTDLNGQNRDYLSVEEGVKTTQFKYLVVLFMILSSG